jgi:hypothetical protein
MDNNYLSNDIFLKYLMNIRLINGYKFCLKYFEKLFKSL